MTAPIIKKKIIVFGFDVAIPPEVKKGEVLVIDCRDIPFPKDTRDRVAIRYQIRQHPRFAIAVREAYQHLMRHDITAIAVGCGEGKFRSRLVADECVTRSHEHDYFDVTIDTTNT